MFLKGSSPPSLRRLYSTKILTLPQDKYCLKWIIPFTALFITLRYCSIMKKRKLQSYQEPLSQNYVVNQACLTCLLLTWIGWPSDIESVHEGNKSKMKVFFWPLPLWYWPLVSRLLPKNKVIRVAENKQWDHGELGCPELTWDGCPCSLALISQVPPTHLLTFFQSGGDPV